MHVQQEKFRPCYISAPGWLEFECESCSLDFLTDYGVCVYKSQSKLGLNKPRKLVIPLNPASVPPAFSGAHFWTSRSPKFQSSTSGKNCPYRLKYSPTVSVNIIQ